MSEQKPGDYGFNIMIYVFLSLVVCALLKKLLAWFLVWIQSPYHFVGIGLAVGSTGYLFIEWAGQKLKAAKERRAKEEKILGDGDGAVFCGHTKLGKNVHIKPSQRTMHTQVVGTTNAGKTESVILPWAIQDMAQGRGLILIDGKSDRSLLDKLYAYAVLHKREKDFRLFSLASTEASAQFNPLIGGTPEEVTERIFNAFDFENPYYRSVQYEVFSQVMRIFDGAKFPPTFRRLYEAIQEPRIAYVLSSIKNDPALTRWAEGFYKMPAAERRQMTSGLTASLGQFAFGSTATLFNTEKPAISLEEAMKKNQILYFQLPVMRSPFLGKACGKLILQGIQAAVSTRHLEQEKSQKLFSVFLDDFSEYLYPGFVTVLNKSRSANVGIVFAHQAMGDIQTMGDAVANSITTNANLKIFMRGNDPDSAEYYSRVIGTKTTTKYTERTKQILWKQESTGDKSAREAEEFLFNPNHFKSGLGVGEAVMVVPHEQGSCVVELKFQKMSDLVPKDLEKVPKQEADGIEALPFVKDGLKALEAKEGKSNGRAEKEGSVVLPDVHDFSPANSRNDELLLRDKKPESRRRDRRGNRGLDRGDRDPWEERSGED